MYRRHTHKGLPRLLSVLLSVLVVAALLSGCGGSAPASGQTAAAEATSAPAAEAPTEAPTTGVAAATDSPTEVPAATEAPTEVPTEAPTEAPAAASAAVSFSKDVMPIFEQTCIKCHGGPDGTKGDLDLRTHASVMKGGKDGAVVVPGNAANSMLVQLIESGKMPRRGQRLPQEQIDLIAQWVNEGALDN